MATYVFSYRSPKGYQPTPEASALWREWFGAIGEAVVSVGQPVGASRSVGECDRASTDLGGFSLVEAPDLDAAVALAEGCPTLSRDGGVEIGELLPVPEAVHGPRPAIPA
ncbi:MAG TPA: YciI family protein [Mycobacteriales bacterium]|jgi:hypothetical protein|nr:YciI family protein [Mycobacteriales bacterium]